MDQVPFKPRRRRGFTLGRGEADRGFVPLCPHSPWRLRLIFQSGEGAEEAEEAGSEARARGVAPTNQHPISAAPAPGVATQKENPAAQDEENAMNNREKAVNKVQPI